MLVLRRVLTLFAAASFSWLASSAWAQTPKATCFPSCRPGFTCSSKGQCVSPCNPACEGRETCSAQGECVDPGSSSNGAAAGCIAANESAVELERGHKLRAARAQLMICAASTCPADIRNECTRRVTSVSNAVPTVIFEVRDATGSETTAVKVTMDGAPLVDHLDGTGIEIEPGEHTFAFAIDGQPELERHFVAHEGEKARRVAVNFATSATEKPAPSSDAEPKAASGGPGASTRRTVGFVVGAAGLAALGLAVYYQATALSRSNESNSAAGSADPNVQATSGTLHDEASQAQTYAIISGAIGIAAVGTGLVLVLTARPAHTDTTSRWQVVPQIGARSAGLSAMATW